MYYFSCFLKWATWILNLISSPSCYPIFISATKLSPPSPGKPAIPFFPAAKAFTATSSSPNTLADTNASIHTHIRWHVENAHASTHCNTVAHSPLNHIYLGICWNPCRKRWVGGDLLKQTRSLNPKTEQDSSRCMIRAVFSRSTQWAQGASLNGIFSVKREEFRSFRSEVHP